MSTRLTLNGFERHNHQNKSKIVEAVNNVIEKGVYILGDYVKQFEVDFASYCGTQYAVAVGNGTDALEIALSVLGCDADSEVITVANAGFYSSTAILKVGARPVYVDIDPNNLLMSAEHLEKCITPKTKAVIVTHLYGAMVDMEVLTSILARHKIKLIEDCAQAHGAEFKGRKAGSWGDLACFSFYPTKNLGGIGDSGCLLSNDKKLAEKALRLRQYGWASKKYISRELGRNSRMDDIQAAVLLALLPDLDRRNEKRRQVVQYYRENLQKEGVFFPEYKDQKNYVAHLCVACFDDRAYMMKKLAENNIEAKIHYPLPDYQQEPVRRIIGPTKTLKHTEKASEKVLSLPCFPEMEIEEMDRVIRVLVENL